VVACVHLIFGASIFYITNKGGMETYPIFYPNATGGRHLYAQSFNILPGQKHFELPTIRDKYDFDYIDMIPQLKLCHAVFLDLSKNAPNDYFAAPRFYAVSLMMFLENNDIRYSLAMPYKTASPLWGDVFHPGFKKEEVKADCIVEEEMRNGRISYKFIQSKWY